MGKISGYWRDLQEIRRIPRLDIHLMESASSKNDPFYQRITREFYQEANRRHPKFPLIRELEWGVALCELPADFDDYFMLVEGAARRNYKKATRLGYHFQPIDFNQHLGAVDEIRLSTDVRQGKLSEEFLTTTVTASPNPIATDSTHGYPYFGVFKESHLRAYAGCQIGGELCMIEHIYGHADHHSDGAVPLLFISIAKYLFENHPQVRYYGYGTYYGAGESMRRFKKKFHFLPHRVRWHLE